MRDFDKLNFDLTKAELGVTEFEDFLTCNESLKEKTQILPFFRSRPNLCGLIGHLNPNTGSVDLISFELSYFRDFSCDVAVGDKSAKAFTLVEFEDATNKSVFQSSRKHRPDWSPRLEHGHSQIVDWLWRLDDFRTTDDFDDTFGKGAQAFTTLLIAGRNDYLSDSMRKRLRWRRDNVVIHSKKILIYTYDELLAALETKVSSFRALLSPGKPVKIDTQHG
jgi:hypothetical protein